MQDRPTAGELLDAVRAFLEEEVVPRLEGRPRFHARVAANVLAILARERATEEATLAAEWARLAALLHLPPPAPSGRDALAGAVRDATAALAEQIRRGEADAEPFARAVRAHVRASVEEKLRVANPRHLAGAGAR
jgi:hypothetical protein